nr:endonuclease domain-containing protein [Deinococcus sp. RM]
MTKTSSASNACFRTGPHSAECSDVAGGPLRCAENPSVSFADSSPQRGAFFCLPLRGGAPAGGGGVTLRVMRDLHSRRLVSRARELRRSMTPAERRLWFDLLRSHPARFRRQVPLLGFILDFYAPSARVCVEVDGASHDSPDAVAYDAERSRGLAGAGIRVLRVRNVEVMRNLPGVAALIESSLRE